MIIDRDAAIQTLIKCFGAQIDPDDESPGLGDLGPTGLAEIAADALGYPLATPRPGDTLARAQLNDLPPGSLIRSEFDGHILERTANGWRYGWDPVSLSTAFRAYSLLLLKEDPHG